MSTKYFTNSDLDKGLNKKENPSRVVWSTGRNIRFSQGYVEKMAGKSLIQTIPAGLPVRAIFTFLGTDGVQRSIVCCDDAIYLYNADFSSYATVTPSPAPTGGATDRWQFALVGGLPILTNGKDKIWKMTSYSAAISALTGAPPTYAKNLGSSMHRLIVSNLSEGGYAYTGRVRWTEVANPENWLIDETNMSGRYDILNYATGQSAHENIKSQISVGQRMYFWTERGLWRAMFDEQIKQFLIYGRDAEIAGRDARCRVDDTIFWIGKRDLYMASGDTAKGIGVPWIRDDFLSSVNSDYLSLSFVFHNRLRNEVWFCIPTGASTAVDTAYIFNYEIGTWTIADVDFLCHSESDYTTLPYDIVGNDQGEILRLDDGFNGYYSAESSAINGVIETGDMALDSPDYMKRVSDVMVEAAVQDTVCELMIQAGVRDRLSDDIKWSDPVPFTLGVTDKCDFSHFRKEGKYVRLRFYSDQLNTPWTIAGLTVKYELGGTR